MSEWVWFWSGVILASFVASFIFMIAVIWDDSKIRRRIERAFDDGYAKGLSRGRAEGRKEVWHG